MTTPAVDAMVGTTLGSFRIVRVIGRGGMGTVYLGEHTVIGSRVAIKVLQDRLATDEGLVARFYAEARAVNLIGHENIVNIFDMNVVPPNRYYLVMEYLEGKPLNYLLTQPVAASVAIPILLQVCDALQAAHSAGIIHRDLKPENIFLIRRGRRDNFTKVLDFGLAKLLDLERSTTKTAAGLIVGTPEFLSPEQANSAPVDGRSDVYSLGCIAWLLATGKLPYPQRGLADLLVAHRSQLPRPPHEVNPNVSRAWSDVIMKSVAKNPAERFQSAQEFAAALESAMGAVPAQSPPSQTGLPVVATPGEPLPRHEAKFDAVVTRLDGVALGTLKCTDISKGGMFLSTTAPLPAVFTRVKVMIPSADLTLLAEVVRHVPADQARAWNMSPGFGVQFLDVTPSLRDTLTRLVQGLPMQPRPTASGVYSRAIEQELEKYRLRLNGDHYEVLGLTADADFEQLRARAREEEAQLAELRKKTKKTDEVAQLDAAFNRVKTARDTLTQVVLRARYDANRGNWKGVARCLAAGLSPTDMERARQEFLSTRPSAAGSAHVKFLASKGYEQNGQLKEAAEACENALQLDPLNLAFHQRYATLKKK